MSALTSGATGEPVSESLQVPPLELGEAFSAIRLCNKALQQTMQLSLSRLGQLTPVQAFRNGQRLEVFDGLKRLRAARALSWSKLRVEVHTLDTTGAKARLLCCNTGPGLAELEEAWLVRSLYREDQINQPQIALLLGRHKSWVCRRLALAEGLSDELTANVRLGLVPATAAVELSRLPRCNQDAVTKVVTRRGLTTRQIAQMVQGLLAAPPAHWPVLLEQVSTSAPKGPGPPRRTPAEQLVADARAMKRAAVKLHARLLERSLTSLGQAACATVSQELTELETALCALTTTLRARLEVGGTHAAA